MFIDAEGLILLILFALAAFIWWQLRAQKEFAYRQARRFCKQQGLQLLDQSVYQSSARLRFGGRHLLTLQQTYHFEFSSTGDERYVGSLLLRGRELVSVDIPAHRI